MNNFLENVNINDLNDNPSQPKKKKVFKKNKKLKRKQRHSSTISNSFMTEIHIK